MAERKRLSCRDAGVDCDFEADAATMEEVIEQCAAHASSNHGMKSFTRELYMKMRTKVRTVSIEGQ